MAPADTARLPRTSRLEASHARAAGADLGELRERGRAGLPVGEEIR